MVSSYAMGITDRQIPTDPKPGIIDLDWLLDQSYKATPRDRKAAAKRFGAWLDARMRAAGILDVQLAEAYNKLRDLRPRIHDARFKAHSAPESTPKKEIGQYRRGERCPQPIVAYRIGSALESLRVACGLDALLAAGHWADAIALLGELARGTRGSIEAIQYE